MKMQFSTATLLLVVSFVGIMLGSVLAWHGIVTRSAGHEISMPLFSHLHNFLVASPYWVPFGVIGYALGRQQLTALMVAYLAIGEAIALGTVYLTVLLR